METGRAASIAAARKGEDLDDLIVGEGSFAFVNHKFKYVMKFDDSVILSSATVGADKSITTNFTSLHALADEKYSLIIRTFPSADGQLKSTAPFAFLVGGQREFVRSAWMLLPVGALESDRDDLGTQLRSAAEGGETKLVSIEDHVAFEGRDVTKVTLAVLGGQRSYWIDVERGAIPLRMHEERDDSLPTSDIYLGELQQVPGQGWFPMTRTRVGADLRVQRWIVQDAEWENPPGPKEFRVEFAEPLSVYNRTDSVVYKPRKIWDLADLPGINSPDSEPVVDRVVLGGPPMPGVRESSPWTMWVAIAAAGSVVVIVAAYLWRRVR